MIILHTSSHTPGTHCKLGCGSSLRVVSYQGVLNHDLEQAPRPDTGNNQYGTCNMSKTMKA